MAGRKKLLVHGWGINDVNYPITTSVVINGKQKINWRCPYYVKWVGMIRRCFYLKWQNDHITYKDCTVADEWKYLSNFIKWVDSQPNRNWQNCHLDKDILFEGNKHYSPETAVFVSKNVNNFVEDSARIRGSCMLGVNYQTGNKNPYHVKCCNPLAPKQRHVGCFATELEAHKAWQAKKHEYACQLADSQEDERVAKALRERYAPDKDWTDK